MVGPEVSVGMPVYNGERFLNEALQSLLRQSHTDFELIISDNASSDRTEAICREHAAQDRRIRYFRQPSNIGAAANFVFVFKQAKAEFFTWAACDDLWDPNWLSTLLAPMRDQRHVFAFGRLSTIDAEGFPIQHAGAERRLSFGGSRPWRRQLRFYLEPEPLGKANLLYALYRRQEIDQRGLRALEHTFGDVVFLFRQLETLRLIQTTGAGMQKRVHKWSAAQETADTATTTIQRLARAAALAFFLLPRDYLSQARGALALAMLIAAPLKGILFLVGVLRSRLVYRER